MARVRLAVVEQHAFGDEALQDVATLLGFHGLLLEEKLIPVFEHKRFVGTSPMAATLLRKTAVDR